MIKNYFKIAFRSIQKNKTSSFINILGLTIGLCSCLLIGLYITHELSYDDFQKNGNRIVRVIMEFKFDGSGEIAKGNYTSVRVAPVFKQTFPEVESAVRMKMNEEVVQYNDKFIDEKEFMYADPSFFNIFSFKLLQGDANYALTAANRVVLTKSTAKKYFGNENPVGKVVRIGTSANPYQITGVMQDCPSNSQIKFDFLASFSSLGVSSLENSYWDANYTTYLLLKSRQSRGPLQAKIASFMKNEMNGQGASINYYLEPFTSIHLHSEYKGFEPNNNIAYIYILEAVAVMILIIACFTYVNLNTARSMERAKEVGIRKVIGAGSQQLFWQFIGESALFCIISIILSLLAATALMPLFNQLTEKQLQASAFFSLPIIIGSVVLIVLVSLLAGGYPALILSKYHPVKVLKGSFKSTDSGRWVRKSLIVFQFSISVMLIVSTIIIQKQLTYIENRTFGYNRDHVLVMKMDKKMLNNYALIKQELKSDSRILNVSRCANSPINMKGTYPMRSPLMPDNLHLLVTANPVDEDFIQTMGLKLVAGTGLSKQDIEDLSFQNHGQNTYHFILNESAAKQLGWTPQQAVGKKMFLGNPRPGYVKGVIKDFNFESVHNAIKPLVLFPELPQTDGQLLLVKLNGAGLSQTLSFLETKWKQLVPNKPFEYYFLDDDFNKLYSSEIRLGKVLSVFAAIAVALACLGLLGLSSYTANLRSKEIGIRKILGARITSLFTLLSKEFLMLVLIALLIAFPITWLVMNKWLQTYTYRTTIEWWVFALSGVVIIMIALATISFHSIKAAIVNPVKSLRSE